MIDSYFLGYHLNHEREIAKYIVALRHGLERDGKVRTTRSPSEEFLGKGVLKISNKFTGEHPCRSTISINLLTFIPPVKIRKPLHVFRTPFF